MWYDSIKGRRKFSLFEHGFWNEKYISIHLLDPYSTSLFLCQSVTCLQNQCFSGMPNLSSIHFHLLNAAVLASKKGPAMTQAELPWAPDHLSHQSAHSPHAPCHQELWRQRATVLQWLSHPSSPFQSPSHMAWESHAQKERIHRSDGWNFCWNAALRYRMCCVK